MEVKWFLCVIATMVVAAGIAGTVNIHKEGRCLETYSTSNRSAEEINLICRGVKSSIVVGGEKAK